MTYIRAKFDRKGLYVWHCHILSHEDNEMMLPYCVGVPGVDCPIELFNLPAPPPVAAPVAVPVAAPVAVPVAAPVAAPAACKPQVVGFRFWNADTDTQIGVIPNNLPCISPTVEYTIDALVSSCTSQVFLKLTRPNNTPITRTENAPLFFLKGDRDNGTTIFGTLLQQGAHTISATPDGKTSGALTYTFNLQYC